MECWSSAVRSAPRGPASILPSLALALFLGACTMPGTGSKADGRPLPGAYSGTRDGAPAWAGQPLGWPKLTAIDEWLISDSWRYEPYWRVQGRLTLAEGRSRLARRDHSAGELDDQRMALRVAAARRGFQEVLSDSAANSSQRSRATSGLRQLERIPSQSRPVAAGWKGVASRGQWGARSERRSRLTPVGGKWRRITVHHSAEVPGTRMDGSLVDSKDALRKMQRAHMDDRNYGDIGYHFLIDSAGRVFEGRSLAWQGAHAGGDNNRHNLGLCLIGDFEHSKPSSKATAALEALLDELRREYSISSTSVVCHRDLKNTVCPGDAIAAWVDRYRRRGPRPIAQASIPVARSESRARMPATNAGSWNSSGVVR